MAWAREHRRTVFTHDLDFSAILAATQAEAPSVIQLRGNAVTTSAVGEVVLRALDQFAEEIAAGAVLSIDPDGARARLLPLR